MTETTRYRKKPVEIEARQLIGGEGGEPARTLAAWCGGWIGGSFTEPHIVIPTLEGEMRATVGDWIIRGVQGEFYPCRDDIFRATYEAAAEAQQPEARKACGCGQDGCEYCDVDDEADDEEPTEEQIVRDHVTTVHLIGEQLTTVESWLWKRLAEVRAEPSAAVPQPGKEA